MSGNVSLIPIMNPDFSPIEWWDLETYPILRSFWNFWEKFPKSGGTYPEIISGSLRFLKARKSYKGTTWGKFPDPITRWFQGFTGLTLKSPWNEICRDFNLFPRWNRVFGEFDIFDREKSRDTQRFDLQQGRTTQHPGPPNTGGPMTRSKGTVSNP